VNPRPCFIPHGWMADDLPVVSFSELSTRTLLSNIGRTVDGHAFAYRSLGASCKRIGSLKGLDVFVHLEHVDLSSNAIKDVEPLKSLPHVVKLDLSQNEIKELRPWEDASFRHLAHLDLSNNSLKELPSLVPFPALFFACFAENVIKHIGDFAGHEKLDTLDLSGNSLSNLTGLGNMPELKHLNVSANELKDLGSLEGFPSMRVLNVSKNGIQSLEGPWGEMVDLREIDASKNALVDIKECVTFRQLPLLRRLGIADNPWRLDSETDVRTEALICHWRLEFIDGQAVTKEELETARLLNVRRLSQEQEERRQAEEAAAIRQDD